MKWNKMMRALNEFAECYLYEYESVVSKDIKIPSALRGELMCNVRIYDSNGGVLVLFNRDKYYIAESTNEQIKQNLIDYMEKLGIMRVQ